MKTFIILIAGVFFSAKSLSSDILDQYSSVTPDIPHSFLVVVSDDKPVSFCYMSGKNRCVKFDKVEFTAADRTLSVEIFKGSGLSKELMASGKDYLESWLPRYRKSWNCKVQEQSVKDTVEFMMTCEEPLES